jgi:uncharacterized protein (DUF58 family)
MNDRPVTGPGESDRSFTGPGTTGRNVTGPDDSGPTERRPGERRPGQPGPGQPGVDGDDKRITWRAAPRLHRLALVAVVGVLAAVLTRQAELLLLAAPALAAAAAGGRGRPEALDARVTLSVTRCFEGEEVEITATVAGAVDEVAFQLEPDPLVPLTEGSPQQSVPATGGAWARWVVTPRGWGRRRPGVVTARCRVGGVWETTLTVRPEPLEVFPHPPPARASLIPAELLLRIGDHAATTAGSGIEFAGIRGYLPGDRLRDLNWAVTSRTGRLHVNERAALRATDLVIMIDAFSEVGPLGDTSLDLAVRGAAGLAGAYLRTGDRVGVVALGGVLRWLSPAPGYRQFFRIVEMVFGIRFASEVIPDLGRVPRTALPPRSLVVLFSPLLDARTFGIVADLRQRGVSLVVVDVLRHEPPPHPGAPTSGLAVRLWRLDRQTMRTSLGVPVLGWDEDAGLDGALAPLRGRRIPVLRP